MRIPALAILGGCALLSGCADTVRVYTNPPGAEVTVDGKPLGPVPADGREVSVEWWTFKENPVDVKWPGKDSVHTQMKKGFFQPKHTDYMVIDIIGALFFLVPGLVAFCFNGMGPEPEQRFNQ